MEPTVPLAEWIAAYLDHHHALGHSPKTTTHYANTFKLFTKYLSAAEVPADSRCLTTATMQDFARYVRETPIRPWRGQTQRSAVGVFGILKDMKAFVRWLAEVEMLARPVKVPIPHCPRRSFRS
jgi:site-specific recombinase XerD